MNDSDKDPFGLGAAWGHMLSEATLDMHDEYPSWLPDVFFAAAAAIEDLPAPERDKVVAAAITAWRSSGSD